MKKLFLIAYATVAIYASSQDTSDLVKKYNMAHRAYSGYSLSFEIKSALLIKLSVPDYREIGRKPFPIFGRCIIEITESGFNINTGSAVLADELDNAIKIMMKYCSSFLYGNIISDDMTLARNSREAVFSKKYVYKGIPCTNKYYFKSDVLRRVEVYKDGVTDPLVVSELSFISFKGRLYLDTYHTINKENPNSLLIKIKYMQSEDLLLPTKYIATTEAGENCFRYEYDIDANAVRNKS